MRVRKGQGLVEFALMLPLVLLMVYGVIELARLMQAYLTVEAAAREGARYAVTGQSITGVVSDRPNSVVAKARGAARSLLLAVRSPSDSPTVENSANRNYLDVALNPTNGGQNNTPITVTVRYNYSPLFPVSLNLLGIQITLVPDVIPIQGQAVMYNERIDKVTPVAEVAGEVGGGGYNIAGATPGTSGVLITLGGASSNTILTDGGGNFTFSSLASGSYTLIPSKSGCTFAPLSINVTLGLGDSTGNNFVATCQSGVRDLSGSISGATGVTVDLSGAGAAATTTDGSGNYLFASLTAGSYVVTPSKTGCSFSPSSRNITLGGTNSTGNNFTATCSFSILGTVSGAAGVTVALSGGSSGSTVTGVGGAYTFASLPVGSYTLTPSKTNCNFTPTSRTITLGTANSGGNDFVADSCTPPTYAISGTVSGDTGVTVTLSGTGGGSTVTSGAYGFSGLAAGNYLLTPSKANCTFTPTSINVALSNANSIGNNFNASCVAATYTISGTVLDYSGAAVFGATITLGGAASATTTTDAAGRYVFTNRTPGTYTLTPSNGSATEFNPSAYSGVTSVVLTNANSTGNNFTQYASCVAWNNTLAGGTGKNFTLGYLNNTSAPQAITRVTLTWPNSAGNLTSTRMGSSNFWSGADNPTSANIASTSFSYAPTIASLSSNTVRLAFANNVGGRGSYTLVLEWTNQTTNAVCTTSTTVSP